jgi:hypothetical protein
MLLLLLGFRGQLFGLLLGLEAVVDCLELRLLVILILLGFLLTILRKHIIHLNLWLRLFAHAHKVGSSFFLRDYLGLEMVNDQVSDALLGFL